VERARSAGAVVLEGQRVLGIASEVVSE